MKRIDCAERRALTMFGAWSPQLAIVVGVLAFAVPTWAYPGPVFDIGRLFEDAPVVCKVVVEEVHEAEPMFVKVENLNWPGAMMATRTATLKVTRSYKGVLPEKIPLLFPYKELDEAGGVSMVMWQTVESGQSLIVFLKRAGSTYRFWYDIYDSKLSVAQGTSEKTAPYEAFQDDVINSLSEAWMVANGCMRQIGQLGWRQALARLQAISVDGGEKYALALQTRLQLGDRTAMKEALTLFDNTTEWPQHYEVENARRACLYLFARQGSRKAQAVLRSIAAGALPWLSDDIQSTAKEQLKNLVSPEDVLRAGDQIATSSLDDDMALYKAGTVVAEAAGRVDWYNQVRQSPAARQDALRQMQAWWNTEGRAVFVQELAVNAPQ